MSVRHLIGVQEEVVLQSGTNAGIDSSVKERLITNRRRLAFVATSQQCMECENQQKTFNLTRDRMESPEG